MKAHSSLGRPLFRTALVLAAGTLTSLPQASSAPPLCHVIILRDYDLAFGYYAVPRLAPSCSAGAVGHLRKSSTLNMHRKGDPVQPVIPLKGYWTVTATGEDVPTDQQFTSGFSSWEWQDSVGGVWRKARVW